MFLNYFLRNTQRRLLSLLFVCCLLLLILWHITKQQYVPIKVMCGDHPTLYEYYTEGGITSGLETQPETFLLNKKTIKIFSGAIHYFRVHPDYWRDRLRKLRAAGFNAVETYVPWNLHEPQHGVYDFGDGGNDMSIFLDIVKYIKTAQEEDLFVLVRPSPYMCAEWTMGACRGIYVGSWLMRFPRLVVRSSESQFVERVRKYNSMLLPVLADLQFTKGGPIIAFQIENEFGALSEDGSKPDVKYLEILKKQFVYNGIVELLFTSDNPITHKEDGALPGVLQTANFQENPEGELSELKTFQPDKPCMVMEFWAGWFDHWFEPKHHTTSLAAFKDVLERIIKFPSSVNLYMFHGGTNFGFMSGANVKDTFPHYVADVTSYDYDAPLTEAGDYTAKYEACKEIVAKYNKVHTKLPLPPPVSIKMAYESASITGQFSFNEIISKIGKKDRTQSENVVNMENLPINNGNGQSYGFVLYRRTQTPVKEQSKLEIKNDAIYDMGIVLLDGERKTDKLTSLNQLMLSGYWEAKNADFSLTSANSGAKTLDILVENWGRVNFGVHANFDQRKGLREKTQVVLDDQELKGWEIISLQFQSAWVKSLKDWNPVTKVMNSPTLFHATFEVDAPHDTFLDMSKWGRGVVFINGFNLGRYFNAGPPQTLYIPAPLLKTGTNSIVVFELFTAATKLVFTDKPKLGPTE